MKHFALSFDLNAPTPKSARRLLCEKSVARLREFCVTRRFGWPEAEIHPRSLAEDLCSLEALGGLRALQGLESLPAMACVEIAEELLVQEFRFCRSGARERAAAFFTPGAARPTAAVEEHVERGAEAFRFWYDARLGAEVYGEEEPARLAHQAHAA